MEIYVFARIVAINNRINGLFPVLETPVRTALSHCRDYTANNGSAPIRVSLRMRRLPS